ncbi:MAG: hypothetical protein A3G24_03180 [Betaproteobacteria bacterium RIFCSPLOWO2_12_FULL_62_13]|nr:MAG: hypothetical protein A3G24_03180 [Betaproteobacteria bacterium RIFCSPLOWO2_12_FULL_62_13]
MIELISPIGYPRVETHAKSRRLDTAIGRRVGFIWNQYQTTRNFWPRLEQALETLGKPSAVQRAYKKNTWMPLEKDDYSELTSQVDYLVIGVGA